MPISSGIMFLMYRIGRLVALVYIRQPQQHWGGAKRKDRRMEDGEPQRSFMSRLYGEWLKDREKRQQDE
jgi:hypothetical protein